jgi:hypothetical protein
VTPGTTSATSSLSVTHGAVAFSAPPPGPAPLYAALWLGLPALVGLVCIGGSRRRKAWAIAMLLLVLLLLPLAGCNQAEQRLFNATFQVRGTDGRTVVTSSPLSITVVP